MLLIQRDRPTHDCHYIAVYLNENRQWMDSEQCRVKDGYHERYVPEWECGNCGDYGGDDWWELSQWELEREETENHKLFYIVSPNIR